MMFLLDTNVVSELRRTKPHGAVLAWLEGVADADLHLSALTFGEIQSGIEITREKDAAKADEIEVPVQVNGKLKARLKVPAEIDDKALEAAALADEAVKAQIAGKAVKMVKVVPRKLVNVVVN